MSAYSDTIARYVRDPVGYFADARRQARRRAEQQVKADLAAAQQRRRQGSRWHRLLATLGLVAH